MLMDSGSKRKASIMPGMLGIAEDWGTGRVFNIVERNSVLPSEVLVRDGKLVWSTGFVAREDITGVYVTDGGQLQVDFDGAGAVASSGGRKALTLDCSRCGPANVLVESLRASLGLNELLWANN